MHEDEEERLPPRQRSIVELLTDLKDDSIRLGLQQVRLAKVKFSQKTAEKARIYGMMAAGGIVAVSGFVVLLLGIASLISIVFGATAGAQAGGQLIVGLIVSTAGGIFTYVTSRKLVEEEAAVETANSKPVDQMSGEEAAETAAEELTESLT